MAVGARHPDSQTVIAAAQFEATAAALAYANAKTVDEVATFAEQRERRHAALAVSQSAAGMDLVTAEGLSNHAEHVRTAAAQLAATRAEWQAVSHTAPRHLGRDLTRALEVLSAAMLRAAEEPDHAARLDVPPDELGRMTYAQELLMAAFNAAPQTSERVGSAIARRAARAAERVRDDVRRRLG